MKKIYFGLVFFGTFSFAQINTSVGGASSVLPNASTSNTNVGIGTDNPEYKLDVNGDIRAQRASFSKSVPNGTNFSTTNEETIETNVLSAGTIVDPSNNSKTFNFFDMPSNASRSKPSLWFSLQNRNDIARFVYTCREDGDGSLILNNKIQEEVFKVYEDGNNYTFLQLGKPNSKLMIGGYADYPNSIGHKLFVQDGSAKVEGAIEGEKGIFTSDLPDGMFFQPGERNDICTVFAAGSKIGSGPGYINTRMVNIFDFPASNNNPQSTIWFNIVDRGDMDRFRMFASTGGATNFIMYNRSQQEIFRVYEDGYDNVSVQLAKPNSFLGIGTTSATDGTDTFNLSVKGKMRAEEVKVYTTWADYVFNDDYQLPSLDEVENHIKEKGHLINMPSGQDIEEKGLFVGEITKMQQEKIEELTLYLIQQQKEIDELKLQVKLLLEKSKE